GELVGQAQHQRDVVVLIGAGAGRAVVAAVQVDPEVLVDVPAEAEDRLIGELGAAQRAAVDRRIDEGDAGTGTDIGGDGRTGRKVVERVGENGELLDAAARVAEDVAEVRRTRAVVGAENALQLDAWPDEV